MSNLLKNKGKKIIISILASVAILIGIPKFEIASNAITPKPLYPNLSSTRIEGEILRSDIKNGKKIQFTVNSNVTMVRYAWNLNTGGASMTSEWINVTDKNNVEIPIDIYKNVTNINDIPLGILELSVTTWDGATSPVWRYIPYYVVDTLTPESNQDKTGPVIQYAGSTLSKDYENNPITVKNGEGVYELNIVDYNKTTTANSTGVYYFIGEVVNRVQENVYSSNAVKRYNQSKIRVGYGNNVDIKLPTTAGTYYLQMYAIDGSNNPSTTYCMKFVIKNDITPPVITLNGGTQYIQLGSTYNDPGAIAKDNVSGNVAVQANTSAVNTKQIGEYKVTYTAKDAENNVATAERTVYVVDRTNLTNKIAEAESLKNSTDFTEESRNALTPVINDAKNKINTSNQSQLDALQASIQNAINNLRIQTPLVDNVLIQTSKAIDSETNKHYLKAGDTITITFTTTSTTINTVENLVINGRRIEASKAKLENIGGFNYKLTYTLTENDSETANGYVTCSFSVIKKVTVNGQEQVSSSETRYGTGNTITSNNIIFDKTAPVIGFTGNAGDKEEVYFGDNYTDNTQNSIEVKNKEFANVSIISDITSDLTNSLGNKTISYTATDKAGNVSAPITRTIEVKDYIKTISLVEDGSKKEYKYNESIDLVNTKISVEMASGTSNNIQNLDALKTYLKGVVGDSDWNDDMFKVTPMKLEAVTESQEIKVDVTAYNGKPVSFTFTVKVGKAENPDMPGEEDITWSKDPENPDSSMTYDPETKSYIVTYDGKPHTIKIDENTTKLPADVTVSKYEYTLIKDADGKAITGGEVIENTGAINAGTYEVKVTFESTSTEYEAPSPITSTLTIKRAELVKDNFKVENNKYDYAENTGRKATITSNIEGVTVKTERYYKIIEENANLEDIKVESTPTAKPTNVGKYVIEIDVDKSANYEAKTKLRVGILEISAIDIDLSTDDAINNTLNITMPETPSKYDGKERIATVTVKDTVTGLGTPVVKYYKNGSEVTNAKNAGTYTVKIYIPAGENYNEVSEKEIGVFTITPREVTITPDDKISAFGDTITAPSKHLTYTLSGDSILTEDVSKISITIKSEVIDNLADGKITSAVSKEGYEITSKVEIEDAEARGNYNITEGKGKYIINKATYNLEGITIDASDVEYTGVGISKEIKGNLPDGIKVSYEYKDSSGNTLGKDAQGNVILPVDAGTYTVVATFELIQDSELANKYDNIVVNGNAANKLEQTFKVTPKTPTIADLKITLPENKIAGTDASYIYDGVQKVVSVDKASEDIKGLGTTFTVKYYKVEGTTTNPGTTTAPTNVGKYRVEVSITAGTNYTKVDNLVVAPELIITKRTIELGDIIINSPTDNQKIPYNSESKVTASVTLPSDASDLTPVIKYFEKVDGIYKEMPAGETPKNVGEYKVEVTIADNENYTLPTDPKVVEFEITAKTLEETDVNVDVKLPEDSVYSPTAKPREAIVTTDTNKVDYTIEYYKESNNAPTDSPITGYEKISGAPTNAGTYKVIVKITGKGNYTGSLNDKIVEGTFKINKATQDVPAVRLNKTEVDYPVSEELKVIFDNTSAESGEVEYTFDNNDIIRISDTGIITVLKSGTVNITVKYPETENYLGSETKTPLTLTINGSNQPKPEISLNKTSIAYTDNDYPVLTISNEDQIQENGGVTITVDNQNYTVSNRKVIPANGNIFVPGKVNVIVTFNATTNYSANSSTIELTIKDILEETDFDVTNNIYDYKEGTARNASVSVKDAIKLEGVKDTDITKIRYYKITGDTENIALKDIQIDENEITDPITNAGKYLVAIDVKETDKYIEASNLRVGILTINKAKYVLADNVTFENKTVPYNGQEQTITVSNLPEGIIATYTGNVGTNAGEYNAIATLSLSDSLSNNYEGISQNGNDITTMKATLTISKIDPKAENFIIEGHDKKTVTCTYDGASKEGEAKVIAADGITGMGDIAVRFCKLKLNEQGKEVEDGTRTETPTEAGSYNIRITVKEGQNYKARSLFSINGKLIINKAIPQYTVPSFTAVEGQTLGDIKNIPEGFAFEAPLNTLVGEVGSREFTMTYTPTDTANYETVTGIKVNVNVIAKELTSIKAEIKENAIFYIGNDIDTNNLIVKGVDNDGAEYVITGYTLNPTKIDAEGPTTVTITYNDKTTTIDIKGTPKRTQNEPKAHIEQAGVKVEKVKITSADNNMPEIVLTSKPEENATVSYDIEVAEGANKNEIITLENGKIKSLNKAGTVTIIVKYNETTTYAARETKITLEVEKDELVKEDFNVTELKHTYTGDTKSANVEVKAGVDIGNAAITKTYRKIENGVPTGEYLTEISNAGDYKVYVSIPETDKYKTTSNLEVGTLTIEKAKYILPNTTVFENSTVTYDGQAHTITVAGMPEGITATYVDNSKTNAGEYNAVATFVLSEALKENYSAVEPATMSAKLTINKAVYNLPAATVFNGDTVDYDGQAHTITVTGIPEGITATYVDNSKTNAGIYNAVATFVLSDELKENYSAVNPTTMSATLTINKIAYVLPNTTIFADKTVTYDGQAHTIRVAGMPEGITATYVDNSKTNAGEYNAVATFALSDALKENYSSVEPASMNAKLTIEKATYDMSKVTFADGEATYDGKPHSLTITGTLPSGVTVKYYDEAGKEIIISEDADKNNPGYVNAGEYTITAKFTGDAANYNTIGDLTAKLTIKKAKYILPNTTVFEDSTVTYDGQAHTITVAGMPEGITATYVDNSKTNAGEYNAVATFVLSDALKANYSAVEPATMNAKLTIKKAKYILPNTTVFEDSTVTYDGQAHTITVAGMPEGITATYVDNSKTNAGEYNAVATFVLSDALKENYSAVEPATMSATLKIEKAVYNLPAATVFNGDMVDYDGQAHTITVTGMPEGITATYVDNSKTNAGIYNAVATFVLSDALKENYSAVNPTTMSATLTINKIAYVLPNTTIFADKTVTYDGQAHTITVAGMPEGITATYVDNSKTNAGEYNAVATFVLSDALKENYSAVEPASMNAKLTIEKATYDMSKVTFADGEATYDGKAHSLTITGTLPSGVTVKYYDEAGKEIIISEDADKNNPGYVNAGEYTITAKFTGDAANYNTIGDLTAKLTIKKAKYILPNTTVFEDSTVTYDGQAHTITVAGMPEGITATYTGNVGTNVGIYNAIATFELSEELKANYSAVEPEAMNAKLTINKAKYILPAETKFEGSTVTYDRQEHTITVTGMPEGITATYVDNSKTNAGTYNAIATFVLSEELKANYSGVEPESMSATLKIEKAIYDLPDNVTFSGDTVTYDTKTHTLEVTGMPAGITATYEYSKDGVTLKDGELPVDAGTYKGVATFVLSEELSENYSSIRPSTMEATLKIEKASQPMPDISLSKNPVLITEASPKVVFKNEPFEEGMITYGSSNPDVATVNPTTGEITLVGAGSAEIIVTYGETKNYTAKSGKVLLTVEKDTLTDKHFELAEPTEVTYDGAEHPVTIARKTNSLGEEIVPGTDVPTDKIDIHYYKVEAGTENIITGAPKNAGTYKVYITIEETDKYHEVAEANKIYLGEFVINKADIKASDLSLNNKTETGTIEYNGQVHEANISISNTVLADNINLSDITPWYFEHITLEDGTEGLKEGTTNAPKDSGVYTVKVIITEKDNYNTTENEEQNTGLTIGTMTIVPKEEEVVITINNKTSQYGDTATTLDYTIKEGAIYEGDDLGITLKVVDENGKDITDQIATLPAGEYSIVGAASNKNYKVSFVDGAYTITKKNLTVKIIDKTSIYGNEMTELEYDFDEAELVNTTDALNIVLNIMANDGQTVIPSKDIPKTDVGSYAIKGTYSNDNYNVTFTNADNTSTNGAYNITERDVTIDELDFDIPQDLIYDGTEKTVSVNAGADITGLGENITIKYYPVINGVEVAEALTGAPVNAGTYNVKVDISKGANYNKVENLEIGVLEIAKREITEDNKDTYLSYTIPERTPSTEGIPTNSVEWDGNAHKATAELIAAFKDINLGIDIKVLYNGREIANGPVELSILEENKQYDVTVTVNGQNFYTDGSVTIGSFKIIDTVNPVITLIGDDEVEIFVGDGYNDKGATALDNHDNDITAKINVANEVNANKAGEYTVTYTVTDMSGNEHQVVRKVNVVKREQNEIMTTIEDEKDRIFTITERGFDLKSKLTTAPADNGGVTFAVPQGLESIATVDKNTGRVTFMDIGNASIMVAFGETEKYNAKVKEYPIVITKADLVAANFKVSRVDGETYTYEPNKEHTINVKAFENDEDFRQRIGEYQVIFKDEAGTIYANQTTSRLDFGEYNIKTPVNAGTYKVFARKVTSTATDWFNETANDIEIGTITIAKATYNMSGVTLGTNGRIETVYNGQVQPVDIEGKTNLPAGVGYTIVYSEENPINAGTYTVTAKFTGDANNYELIPDMTATYVIKKKPYTQAEIDGIAMKEPVITEDKNVHVFTVNENTLPEGLSVDYYSGDKEGSKVKVYTVIIHLKADNNHELPSPSTITRTVRIVGDIPAPTISYAVSIDPNDPRGEAIGASHDRIDNAIVFNRRTDVRWDSGYGILTKVDSTGRPLNNGVIAEGTGSKVVTLKDDGYYKIESTLKLEGESRELKTVRYIRMAASAAKRTVDGTLVGNKYTSSVEVTISDFDNLQYISLDILTQKAGESAAPKRTLDKICTADGKGNVVIPTTPQTDEVIEYRLEKKSDGTIKLIIDTVGGFKGMARVNVGFTNIAPEGKTEGSTSTTVITMSR